ncbi:hypothetical protein [Streptomyces sp. NPDC093225]|uniref:hypothetical protein n=1 Tax=Streptomyces sp. NPDC093225 TaxID=3366034 RepID=UPI00382C6FB1
MSLTAPRPSFGPLAPSGRRRPAPRTGLLPGFKGTAGRGTSGVSPRRSLVGLLPTVLIGSGVALLPWMVVLAKTLPQTTEVSHWATAWVGLDALIAAGLLATGVLLRKGDPRLPAAAAATATLLVTDAWFDITTAPAGAGLATAVAMAACAELPLAGACAALAVRTPGRRTGA